MIIDRDNFELGTHLIICDSCHRTIKFNKAAKNWNGLWVCRDHVKPDPNIALKPPVQPRREGAPVKEIQKDGE